MFAFSYKLTLFSMLVIPVSAFFIARIVKTLRSQAARAQQVYGVMISYLDEALSGFKIIKAFNATSFIKKRFHDENVNFSTIARPMAIEHPLSSPVSLLLGGCKMSGIVLYGS